MGYDFTPRNSKAGGFHLGAFSFPVLLEQCGWLFACAQCTKTGKWMAVFGRDPRMPEGDDYPRLISNDGFRVTAEEARIIARIAGNYCAYQRLLSPGDEGKIREDFVEKFERFAEWLPKSRGFTIN